MTLPPVIRIFFALDLARDAKEQITAFIVCLKKQAKTHAIRWTKPENLHITLQFLAEVHTEDLPNLITNVRLAVQGRPLRATVKLGAIRLFPNPYRPRVIVFDIAPQDKLAALAELIGEGIKGTQYPIDSRPFRGHLTIGRIKQPQEVNLSFLTSIEVPTVPAIALNEIVLFRSEPQTDGSKYTIMENIKLD